MKIKEIGKEDGAIELTSPEFEYFSNMFKVYKKNCDKNREIPLSFDQFTTTLYFAGIRRPEPLKRMDDFFKDFEKGFPSAPISPYRPNWFPHNDIFSDTPRTYTTTRATDHTVTG